MTTGNSAGSGKRTWVVMVTSIIIIVAGVALVASTFINNLFEVGPAFEEMIDDFRPLLEDASLAQMEADLAGLGAVYEEFTTVVPAGMGQMLGMSPEQFGEFMATQYPDVAAGVAAMPTIGEQFTVAVRSLSENKELFESADAIPTTSLPATTVPWGIFLSGIGAIIVGIVLWFTGRIGAVLAVILGLLLIIVPVALSLPQKAADADELNENLEPIYTAELVQGGKQAITVMTAMAVQMQQSMIPELAQQLGMTPEEVGGLLAENFPATGAILGEMEDMLNRFGTTVQKFEDNLDNYETLKEVKLYPIVWTIIIAGIVILIAGAWALIADIFAEREDAGGESDGGAEPEVDADDKAQV